MDATQKVVEATRKLAEGVTAIEGLELRGSADLCVVAFSSKVVDVWALADRLEVHGWNLGTGLQPPSLRFALPCFYAESFFRFTVTLAHTEGELIESLLSTLREAVDELVEKPSLGDSSRTSAMLSLSGRVDRSIAQQLAAIRLHALHSMPPAVERRTLRSLSVEGRKLSMMVS